MLHLALRSYFRWLADQEDHALEDLDYILIIFVIIFSSIHMHSRFKVPINVIFEKKLVWPPRGLSWE